MPARRLIVLTIALAACNYDWTYRPDAGTPSSSQKDAGGDPTIDSGPGPNEKQCAVGKETCPVGQYCRFGDRTCGAKDQVGTCEKAGVACEKKEVCACNKTMMNDCDAQQSGIDVDETGTRCGTASGTFPCGTTTCITDKEVCVNSTGGSKCATCADGCKCTAFADCICKEAAAGEVSFECK